jgi:predicted phage terminase large subunit-like protein
MGPAASGQILYVAKDAQGKEWFSTEPFTWNGARAMSRTFVMSLIDDNPAMLDAEPDYRSKVRDNDPVRAAQLELGDWEISYRKGEMFRRERFELVDGVPEGHCTWVRSWDFAGTEPNEQNTDPDWTIGLKMGRHEDGFFYIEHVHRQRDEPGEVEAKRAHFADGDGAMVKQLYPRDPAEAGKTIAQLRVSAAIDSGVDADMVPATKNVLSKAGAVSAAAHPRAMGQAEGYGKIRVVRGPWNNDFFDVLESFPKGSHDDDVSALADAYNYLMSAPGWTPPVPQRHRPAMRLGRGRGFG